MELTRPGSAGRVTSSRSPQRSWYVDLVRRKVRIWTWDRGQRLVDMDGPAEAIAPVLNTVLNGALWRELKRFPVDTLERLLPRIDAPPNVRRFVEIWIEERRARPAA